MTTDEAFEAGSGFASGDIWTLIVAAGCVVILMVAAWVLISCYRGWAKENLDAEEATITAVKAVLVVVIMFWILLS